MRSPNSRAAMVMTMPQFRIGTKTRLLPLSFFCLLAVPGRAQAQWRDAVAVSAAREAIASPVAPVLRNVPPNDNTWHAGGFWRWTAVGLLAGAIAADGWAALQMASNNSGDGGMISPVIPLVIVGAAGGVGGGVIGAIAYTASHSPAEQAPR
jgi:hypothetical protein